MHNKGWSQGGQMRNCRQSIVAEIPTVPLTDKPEIKRKNMNIKLLNIFECKSSHELNGSRIVFAFAIIMRQDRKLYNDSSNKTWRNSRSVKLNSQLSRNMHTKKT